MSSAASRGMPPPAERHRLAELPLGYLDRRQVRRYLTQMRTTLSTKGQLVIPAELRQRDAIEPGQEFEIERIDRGEYRLVRRNPPANEGLLDWLLACPEKGYFVGIESESTDTL
jgi:AbrB family looped-hinge helix DNA binding protein